MTTPETVDQERSEAFTGQVFTDLVGFANTVLSSIGDRLGLFRELAAGGPATSAELAARAGTDERYTREWLGGMASARYLEYEPATGRFRLPPEHVPTLAEEDGLAFLGGVQENAIGCLSILEPLLRAFRNGGGVPISAFDPSTFEGMERFTSAWFENLLVQEWLPLMPRVEEQLARGGDVADVGCGSGRALIKLAQAYPNGRYTGYDADPATVARARANAERAGVGDRVRFERRDASRGLPDRYDVITTFDVVHDAADPRGMLRCIRDALRPDGTYVCVDINCSDRLEENVGPAGAFFHGASVLFCLTVSLATGGEGLGTLGLHEAKLRELAEEAGFGQVRRVPIENPFNNLYEIHPGVGGV